MTTPTFSGSLRYPYEAITDKTDYLQLAIYKYDTAGYGTNNLLANQNFVNQNAFSAQTIASGMAKNKVLADGGVILLPMPSNIEDSNSVDYGVNTFNAISAGAIEGATSLMTGVKLAEPSTWGQAVTTAYNKAVSTAGLSEKTAKDLLIKQLAANAVNVFGSNITIDQLLAREGGKIFNPNMELLFNNVTLRTFKFSFKMTPRDENESVVVKSIIRSLKKNMAPSSGNATGDQSSGKQSANIGKLFLNTPNIFELQYMKGNKLHPYLNRFKPCALSDMSVNYTGENVYATYADGTPVSMTLSLTFKELVPIYKEDYDDSAFNNSTDSAAGEVFDSNFSDNDLVYGVDGQAPNGVQRNVEGVGY